MKSETKKTINRIYDFFKFISLIILPMFYLIFILEKIINYEINFTRFIFITFQFIILIFYFKEVNQMILRINVLEYKEYERNKQDEDDEDNYINLEDLKK